MRYTTHLSDDQSQTLADYARAYAVAGDSDWRVAVAAYRLTEAITQDGVTVPAGLYVRYVEGNHVNTYAVEDVDLPALIAEIATVEAECSADLHGDDDTDA